MKITSFRRRSALDYGIQAFNMERFPMKILRKSYFATVSIYIPQRDTHSFVLPIDVPF